MRKNIRKDNKNSKWPENVRICIAIKIPNGHEIHQSQDLQKYTQIVIFVMKINHLATLG
jgi:hypothetical protein